jgi:F-type H+-transporting ATPase subunit delta
MTGRAQGAAAARRYARALFDVAQQQQGDCEALRREIREAVALLGSHKELRAALEHPALSTEAKRKLVEAVWAPGRTSPLLARLMALLADKGRIGLLAAIDESFGALWNAHRGVVAAEAVSAVPLDEAQTRAVTEALRKATGKEVELQTRADPALQGGILVRMAGMTYDGTVRGRLRALRQRLVGQAGNP